MTYKRCLKMRAQQSLVALLTGALLVTSLPLTIIAANNGTPAAKAVTASKDTVATNRGAVEKVAASSNLAAATNSKAATSAALQEKLSKATVCGALTPRNGPEWGNRQGWDGVEHYETIKLADIDGDGSAELFGRAADGLEVYGWSKELNRWVARNDLPVLSDARGYDKPQYYETIQFANVDNQPGAELLVRGPRGVEVYGYNKNADSWTHLTDNYDQYDTCDEVNGLPASDACGYDKPQYYEKILAADLDGDKRAELIIRGPDGVHVWQWNVTTNKWVATAGVLGLSDAAGYYHPQYYRTLQTADIDGDADGAVELLVRASDGIHTHKWKNGAWSEPYGVLALTDDAGWRFEQNYLTIQTADFDGKGKADLLAREAAGVVVYRLDNGSWVGPIANTLALADDGGWNQPQYYRTIQAADLDGDKRAELIARNNNGLLVYTFNGQFAGPQATFKLMNDGAGWDKPASYLTIQTADVDGDKRADIIGRSSKELETVHYNGKRFFQKQLVGTFPAFTGNQLAVYQYISNQLLSATHPDRNDMRKVYPNTILSDRFNDRLERLTRPERFAAADWDLVFQQLERETDYLLMIKDWFDYQLTLATQFGLANKESFDVISGLLALKTETKSPADIVFLVFKTLLDLAATLIPEGGPEVKEIFEGIKKVVELTETTIETAQEAVDIANDRAGGDEEFDNTVADMRKELSDNYENSITANDCLYEKHLQDWDLMQSLAAPIEAGDIATDPEIAAEKFQDAANDYKLEVWQALTAVHWEILRLGFGESDAPDYIQKYYFRTRANTFPYYIVLNGPGYVYPTQATVEALFQADSTGWPGVKVEDLFRGRNGWRLPGSVKDTAAAIKSGPHCVTRCFRAPEFYWRNAGNLPPGRVRVVGSFFNNNQISTSDAQAMRRILSAGDRVGQPTPLEEFNQQFVALQLNLMSGPALTDELLHNELNCYRARFGVVQLSNRVQLTSGTSLKVLIEQVWIAALGNRGADFAALATVLEALNGNDAAGGCSTTNLPIAR